MKTVPAIRSAVGRVRSVASASANPNVNLSCARNVWTARALYAAAGTARSVVTVLVVILRPRSAVMASARPSAKTENQLGNVIPAITRSVSDVQCLPIRAQTSLQRSIQATKFTTALEVVPATVYSRMRLNVT